MATAKLQLDIGYDFQKPLQGKRNEDPKWLYLIVL